MALSRLASNREINSNRPVPYFYTDETLDYHHSLLRAYVVRAASRTIDSVMQRTKRLQLFVMRAFVPRCIYNLTREAGQSEKEERKRKNH